MSDRRIVTKPTLTDLVSGALWHLVADVLLDGGVLAVALVGHCCWMSLEDLCGVRQ